MRMAYLVSSHFSYASLALPILLPSMRAAGINPRDIFVIVCGCVREFEQRGPDCNFWFVKHESRNFCTFVEAVNPKRSNDLLEYTHVFCLLDTSRVGTSFKTLTDNVADDMDAVGAHPHKPYVPNPPLDQAGAQCDLAAYSLDHLNQYGNYISIQYRNCHPETNLHQEGDMFLKANNRSFYRSNRHNGDVGGCGVVAGPADVYGTGTQRITEYYTAIDLYRFKSNWGQNGSRLLDRI